jgi:hypothetical protein
MHILKVASCHDSVVKRTSSKVLHTHHWYMFNIAVLVVHLVSFGYSNIERKRSMNNHIYAASASVSLNSTPCDSAVTYH